MTLWDQEKLFPLPLGIDKQGTLLNYQITADSSMFGNFLAPLRFLNLSSAPNRACGPEARAWRGKSIGGERIPAGDPPWLPQNGAGHSGNSNSECRFRNSE
jgi:hypothetical protein